MKSNMKQFLILSLIVIISLTGCGNYGKKVNHEHVEVFYKDGISEEQAQKTADLFYMMDANNTAGIKRCN